MEIQELTYIIKQDISNLNQQIGRLQQFQMQHGGHGTSQSQQHSNNVVVSLQTRLATMSTTFKDVLETRTEVCFVCYVQGISRGVCVCVRYSRVGFVRETVYLYSE